MDSKRSATHMPVVSLCPVDGLRGGIVSSISSNGCEDTSGEAPETAELEEAAANGTDADVITTAPGEDAEGVTLPDAAAVVKGMMVISKIIPEVLVRTRYAT